MAISITEQNIQDLISWYNEHLYISAVLDSGVTPSKITINADGDSLAKVKQLHLDERPIKSIEGVEKLNVSECDLRSLPENLFSHRLKEVYISGNTGQYLDIVQNKQNVVNMFLN